MKILHIISSGGMYGAEAVILNLSRTLNRQGHISILGIFSNSKNPNLQLHECALAEGVESSLISCDGQIDLQVPARIRALAQSTGADVVHAHGYKADVYAYFAMRGRRIALVSTCHNWLDDNRMVWAYGIADRRTLRKYAAIVAVSEDVKRRLISSGVPTARIHLIQNGIDLRPFDGAVPCLHPQRKAPGSLLVGWVGRLSPEKGPDIFLRAAAKVHPHLSDTQFVLVGDGPDRSDLERLARELGISNNVRFLGRRTDMPAVYASFDLMVSSSRREGLPMAILEGMASRLPWIATAVGDVPSIIQDGQTGILIEPGDTDRLATALTSLLQSEASRAALGRAARALVESTFSAERMTAEYLHVYSAAIERLPTHGSRSA